MLTPRQADQARRLMAIAEEARTSGDDHDVAFAARLLTSAARQFKAAHWTSYPWQHPHRHPGERQHHDECPADCRNPHVPACSADCSLAPAIEPVTHAMWLQLGGRGTGKTEGAARYVNEHALGPPCDNRLPGGHRMLIVAPTQGDGVEACFRGPSGLRTVNPDTVLVGSTGGLRVVWPNNATARILGAFGPEDVERLRAAGNTCLVWMEELAAQRHLGDALTHTAMGLRLGSTPHYVGSTTPKPRPEVRALLADPATIVTKGKTRDAVRLDPSVLQSYLDRWEGTRQGRQELDADLLDDIEGALWVLADIDDDRHKGPLPEFDDIVVGLDPPGSSGPGTGAEAGIIVVGRAGREAWPLADLSGRMSPEEWGRTAVDAWNRYGCSVIAAETTYGGEMVVSTLRTIDDTIPVVKMPTKVGKRLRAEPVVALYEQHRVHHAGLLPVLEDQMTTWVPGEGESPDRVDALVHALHYLLVRGGQAKVGSAAKRRIPDAGPGGRSRAIPTSLAARRRLLPPR